MSRGHGAGRWGREMGWGREMEVRWRVGGGKTERGLKGGWRTDSREQGDAPSVGGLLGTAQPVTLRGVGPICVKPPARP